MILAKTVKGYGMGKAGEAKNTTHSQKKMSQEQQDVSRSLRTPIADEVGAIPFIKPDETVKKCIICRSAARHSVAICPHATNVGA